MALVTTRSEMGLYLILLSSSDIMIPRSILEVVMFTMSWSLVAIFMVIRLILLAIDHNEPNTKLKRTALADKDEAYFKKQAQDEIDQYKQSEEYLSKFAPKN